MNSTDTRAAESRKRRRWFHFRLRTLLAFVTLIAVLFGSYHALVRPYLVQAEIRDAILAVGGKCEYGPAPHWLSVFVGPEHACVVTAVDLRRSHSLGGFDLLHPRTFAESRTDDINHEKDFYASGALLNDLGKLHQLESLNVAGQNVTDEMVESWSGLTQLERLIAYDTLVRDPAEWPDFPLTTLDVSWTTMRDQHVAALAKYESLEKLNLSNAPITDVGLELLAHLPQLRSLILIDMPISEASCEVLNGLPHLDLLELGFSDQEEHGFWPDAYDTLRLPILIVEGSSTGDGVSCTPNEEGIQAARATLRKKLAETNLEIDEGYLIVDGLETRHLDLLAGNAGVKTLLFRCEFVPLDQLVYLSSIPNLSRVSLSIYSAEALQRVVACPGLENLSIGGPGLNDALVHLAVCHRLETLSLRSSEVTNAGLRHIARIESLTTLHISHSNVTDAGFVALAGHPNLETLYFSNGMIDDGSGLSHLCSVPQLSYVWIETTGTKLHYNGRARVPPPALQAESIAHFKALAEHIASRQQPEEFKWEARWWESYSESPVPKDRSLIFLAQFLIPFGFTPEAVEAMPPEIRRPLRKAQLETGYDSHSLGAALGEH